MTTYNRYYESWFRGNNTIAQGSGYTENVSLRNDGRSELRGDVFVSNNGRVMIGKDQNTTSIYYLDVSGNTNFSNIQTTDLVIANKNKLSNIQVITGTSTTLLLGSPEYVSVNCPTNSNIYLPTITSITQIGIKFTFYFGSNNYPTVSINGASGQTIIDNIYAQEVSSINISYSRPFLELVCVNYPTKCWALCNGANDYNLFPQTSTSNSWSAINTFTSNVILTSPAILFTNYIQTIGALLLGNPSGATTNLMTSLVIGSANPFTENSNNPSSGISSIGIQTKRGGTLTLGNASANGGGNINIYTGQYTITIGGGVSTTNGIINIGNNSGGYYNTVNLCSGTSSNILNLGSATSTINLLGNITANSVSISPTLLSYLSGLTGNIQNQLNLLEPITALANYALLASPTFTGSPQAPTQATTDNTTNIATTAYVKANLSNYSTLTLGNTFSGTQTFNSSGVWNVPSGGSFNLKCNGVNFLELAPMALYSPISFSSNLNQITFNGYVVFKTGFNIENGQTLGIGTSGYGNGYIQVGSGYINIRNSGGFFTNWIEPSSAYGSASWFTTHSDTLTFGGSGGNIIMAFANTTIQNAVTFSAPPTMSGANISATSINGTSLINSTITQGKVSNGYVDLSTAQTIAGIKTFSSAPVMSGASISSNSIPDGALSTNIPLLNGSNNFTASNQFTNITYTGTLNSISPTVFGYISGLTSSVQTQINNILNGTSSFTNISYTGNLNGISTTTLGYISDLTGSAQQQINNILSGTSSHTNITYTGTLNSVSPTVFGYISGLTSSVQTQINNILNGTSSFTNITYTGTLNSVSPTVFGYISGLTSSVQTQINNILNGTSTFSSLTLTNKLFFANNSSTIISSNITLSFPFSEYYSISATSVLTVTLPTITASNVGSRVVFRRVGGTTTIAISFIGNGSQSVFNSTNTGGTTAQALMPSGSYIVKLAAMYITSTTFGWFQV